MKRTITISYSWDGEIRPEHEDALEETAQDQIFEAMTKGWRSGALEDWIRLDDSDPAEGREYHGWFEVDAA
jgi:hypothetical protein